MPLSAAARADQQRLKAFMTAAAERGESGTVSDLLDGFFERVDNAIGFGEAAAMVGMDPNQYAPTTAMRGRGVRIAMAEELIARVAEQNAEGMVGTHQSGLRGLVAGFFDQLGGVLKRLRLNRLAEAARAIGAGIREAEPVDTPTQDHLSAIMSGVRAASGMDAGGMQFAARMQPVSASASPMNAEAVEAMVERVTADWPAALADGIEVFADPAAIPAHQRPNGAVDGDFRGVAGYYLPSSDTVALIASEIRGAVDAERTLWHETMHRALREPLDPDHPIAAHARVYQSLMQASGNQPGDYFALETLERIHAAQAEAVERCGDPRFAPAFAGAAMVEALIDTDPASLPATHRPSVAVALDISRGALDAGGYGALAGALDHAYERCVDAACLDHETQFRRFVHDAERGSTLYNQAEILAEQAHGQPAWMIGQHNASDPASDSLDTPDAPKNRPSPSPGR